MEIDSSSSSSQVVRSQGSRHTRRALAGALSSEDGWTQRWQQGYQEPATMGDTRERPQPAHTKDGTKRDVHSVAGPSVCMSHNYKAHKTRELPDIGPRDRVRQQQWLKGRKARNTQQSNPKTNCLKLNLETKQRTAETSLRVCRVPVANSSSRDCSTLNGQTLASGRVESWSQTAAAETAAR